MRNKLFKGGLTVLGAILLSTIGIFASDRLQGIDRELVGLAGDSTSGTCRAGMVRLSYEGKILCVDAYEAAPSEACPHQDPTNILETEKNANTNNCYAASVSEKLPWTFVSLPQAQRLCAHAGKRLPTADEWYKFALDSDPTLCITEEPNKKPGGGCPSGIGVFDAIGNVWEWVDETVTSGTYENRPLPAEGYVHSVDASGIAITSDQNPDELYGADYFWSKPDGVFGMIRGGFYGSGHDAGLYTINASVPTSFGSQGVGFRCVEDVI